METARSRRNRRGQRVRPQALKLFQKQQIVPQGEARWIRPAPIASAGSSIRLWWRKNRVAVGRILLRTDPSAHCLMEIGWACHFCALSRNRTSQLRNLSRMFTPQHGTITFENQSLRSFPVIPFLPVLRKVQPLIFMFRQNMKAGCGRAPRNTQNRNHESRKQIFCHGYQPGPYNSKSKVPAPHLNDR
jgi:hypothetical protein